MDEVEIQTNIKKSAKIVDISLKVGKILLAAVTILLTAVFALTVLIYGVEGSEGFFSWIVSENVISSFGEGITIPAGVDPATAFIQAAVVCLTAAIAYLVLFGGMVWSAAKIFSEIRRTGLPFTWSNARQLKHVSVWLGLLALVPALIEGVGSYLIKMPMANFYLSIELLIAAGILYCLAHIFEYGTLLQQQADETL